MPNDTTPNPGSKAAIAQGCSCPVLDNGNGWGYLKEGVFVRNFDCPLHGEATWVKEAK